MAGRPPTTYIGNTEPLLGRAVDIGDPGAFRFRDDDRERVVVVSAPGVVQPDELGRPRADGGLCLCGPDAAHAGHLSIVIPVRKAYRRCAAWISSSEPVTGVETL